MLTCSGACAAAVATSASSRASSSSSIRSGPDVLSGLIVYPFDQAKSVLTQFAALHRDDAGRTQCLDGHAQGAAAAVPARGRPRQGDRRARAVLCAAIPPKGEKLIEPLRKFGTPLGEHVGVQPYTAWQQAFDPLLAPGARNYWKSHNFSELSDGAIDMIIEYAGDAAVAAVRDLHRHDRRPDHRASRPTRWPTRAAMRST